jgi:hypothetical protein
MHLFSPLSFLSSERRRSERKKKKKCEDEEDGERQEKGNREVRRTCGPGEKNVSLQVTSSYYRRVRHGSGVRREQSVESPESGHEWCGSGSGTAAASIMPYNAMMMMLLLM